MEIQGPYSPAQPRARRGRSTAATGSTRSSARGPTRSRAAPPRSRRTSSASACSACRRAKPDGLRLQPGAGAAARAPRGSSSRTSAPPGSCGAMHGRAGRHRPTSSGRSWPSRAGSASIYPEAYGGMGLGLVDLTVAAWRRWAARSCPGRSSRPCFWAGWRSSRRGREAQKKEWLPKIAAGEAAGALALDGAERAAGTPPGVTLAAGPRRAAGFTLSGTKLFVPDAHTADAARGGRADRAPTRTPRRRREPLPRARRTRTGVAVTLLPDDGPDAQALRGRRSSDVDGRRRRAARSARDAGWPTAGPRARSRHRRALRRDVRRRPEGARHDDGVRQDPRRPSAGRSAPTRASSTSAPTCWWTSRTQVHHLLRGVGGRRGRARGAAGRCAWPRPTSPTPTGKVAGDGIQVHGGIGFTWEHDLHLYFKRAKGSEFTFGDATHHRERVAQLLEL